MKNMQSQTTPKSLEFFIKKKGVSWSTQPHPIPFQPVPKKWPVKSDAWIKCLHCSSETTSCIAYQEHSWVPSGPEKKSMTIIIRLHFYSRNLIQPIVVYHSKVPPFFVASKLKIRNHIPMANKGRKKWRKRKWSYLTKLVLG